MKPINNDTLFIRNYFVKANSSEVSDSIQLNCLPEELICSDNSNGLLVNSETLTTYKLAIKDDKTINLANSDWVFFILLLSVSLFAFIRFKFSKYIELTIVAFFNRKRIDTLHRSTDIRNPLAENLLYIVFLLNFGLIFFFSINYRVNIHIFKSEFLNFVIAFLFIFSVYGIKMTTNSLIGYIFSEKELAAAYNGYIKYHNRIIGLLLLPWAIFLFYSHLIAYETVLYVLFSLIIIVLLVRLFRGFQIILLKDISIVYLILYFCTLEILPLFLIATILFKVIV